MPGVASREIRLVPIIVELVREGWAERILLSQDICHRSHFKPYGGNCYDYLLTTFRDTVIRAGIDEAVLHTISADYSLANSGFQPRAASVTYWP